MPRLAVTVTRIASQGLISFLGDTVGAQLQFGVRTDRTVVSFGVTIA